MIGITAATGQLGRLVADKLLDRVDPAEIVLIAHQPERLAAYAEKGVQVRQGDFNDQASLQTALEAAEKAGGDKRVKNRFNSAAMLVVREGADGKDDRMIDLRVDDHKAPLEELARLLQERIKKPAPKDDKQAPVRRWDNSTGPRDGAAVFRAGVPAAQPASDSWRGGRPVGTGDHPKPPDG